MRESIGESGRRACNWILRNTVIEVLDDVANPCEGTVMEEGPRILELPQCDHAELECVLIPERNLFSSLIVEIRIVPGQAVQCLKRMIPDSNIDEIFFY